jgi:hypothetical protein
MKQQERRLAVVQSADRVGQDDMIEWSIEGCKDYRILDVAEDEMQMRMALARFLDDRRAEVDANADGWLEARKQIPYSATELHDFRALGNEEPHQPS